MVDSHDLLELKHEICKTMNEAQEKAEALGASFDYHILVKKNKIVLVWHYTWCSCDWCEIDKNNKDPFIFL